MRVFFTTHHELDVNTGAAGSMSALASAYRGRGHDVRVLSYSDMPSWLPWHVKTLCFPPYVALRLWHAIRTAGVDVIDTSTGDAWLWASVTSAFDGRARPLLVTRSHGLEHAWHRYNLAEERLGRTRLRWRYRAYHGGYRLWEVEQSLRAADLALFLNRDDLELAVSELGVDPDRAAVLANGIPDYLLGLPAPRPREPDDELRVAHIGTFLRRKGIEYGAEALGRVLSTGRSATLTLLGTRRSPEEVLSSFEPSVRSRIDVVPRFARTELPELLAGHHVVLFPTLSEGFGVGLLEAMACGLAPVSTTTAGPRAIVRDGVDGLLVPTRDSAALAAVLERLMADPDLLQRLRTSAHARAQGFGWERIATRTLELYEEALAARTATGRAVAPAVR